MRLGKYGYLALGLVVVFGLIWLLKPAEKSSVSDKPSQTQLVTDEGEKQSLIEESKTTLEQPNSPVKNSKRLLVKESLDVAMAYLSTVASAVATEALEQEELTNERVLEVLSSIQGTYDNRLSITRLEMIQTLVTMLSIGYHYDSDSLQVFDSDSDNVYQFLVILSGQKEGQLSFVGNYVIGTGQLEITSMQGKPVPQEIEKGEYTNE